MNNHFGQGVFNYPLRSPAQTIFLNGTSKPDSPIKPDNQWTVLDIPEWMPDNTRAVIVHGIGIITNRAGHWAGWYLAFRKHGDSVNFNPDLQASAVPNGRNGGVRANMFSIIPIINRKYEARWNHTSIGSKIAHDRKKTTVSFNLKVSGYITDFNQEKLPEMSEMDVRKVIDEVMTEKFEAPDR